MGLDINSMSDKDYHYSYSGLHYIRFMAYRSIDGKDDYTSWHKQQGADTFKGKFEEAMGEFPNLYWHSDCDGSYTFDGTVESFESPSGLQTGNSRELLSELQFIKDVLPKKHDGEVHDRDWYVFNMFYDVVKDVVENHDGYLEFC